MVSLLTLGVFLSPGPEWATLLEGSDVVPWTKPSVACQWDLRTPGRSTGTRDYLG